MGKDSSPLMKGAKTIGVSFAKPKLKASKMSFVRAKKAQAIKAEDLKGPETVSTGSLAATLSETNRILVEIQNQLAIDFANRIAEKKGVLELSRKQVRKKKLGEKEQFVEKGKKLEKQSSIFGSKVLKPIKSIFDKLIDFLTIVGGGIILNAAWEWLQDEKNRENLIKVFTFLKNYWKEILIGILTLKVIEKIVKLARFAKRLKNLFSRLGKLGPRGGTGRGAKPGSPEFCNGVVNCITKNATSVAQDLFNNATFNQKLDSRIKSFIPSPTGVTPTGQTPKREEQGGQQQEQPTAQSNPIGTFFSNRFNELMNPKPISDAIPGFESLNQMMVNAFGLPETGPGSLSDSIDLSTMMMGGGGGTMLQMGPQVGKIGLPLLSRIPLLRNLFKPKAVAPAMGAADDAARAAKGSAVKSADDAFSATDDIVAQLDDVEIPDDILKQITKTLDADDLARSLQTDDGVRTGKEILDYLLKEGYEPGNIKTTEQLVDAYNSIRKLTRTPVGKAKGGTIRASQGMTVPGRGSGTIDSVHAMLAPGEEVIKTQSANMFRPVLKDINDNAGRMFIAFRDGVNRMRMNNDLQAEQTNRSLMLFGKFKELLDGQIQKIESKQFVDAAKTLLVGNTTAQRSSTQNLLNVSSNETQTQNPVLKVSLNAPTQNLNQYNHRRSTTTGGEGSIQTLSMNLPGSIVDARTPVQAQPEEQPRDSSSTDIMISPVDSNNPFFDRSSSAYGVVL